MIWDQTTLRFESERPADYQTTLRFESERPADYQTTPGFERDVSEGSHVALLSR